MSIALADLVSGAKELADMQGDPFVTTVQWRLWVNEGLRELHRLVSLAYADTFYTTKDFTLAAAVKGVYTLPTDFMRIRGLDLDPDTSRVKTIHRFDFGERNTIGRQHYSRFHRRLRYRVVSRTTLILRPVAEAVGNFRLYYVKRPVLLTTVTPGTTDILQDELDPWSEYIEVYAGIKALAKKERDPSALVAQRDLLRADIVVAGAASTDENESDTVVDVEDDWLDGAGAASGGGAE